MDFAIGQALAMTPEKFADRAQARQATFSPSFRFMRQS